MTTKNQLIVEKLLRTLGVRATVTITKNNHLKIRSGQLSRLIFTGKSPSCSHHLKNLKSDIIKARL